MSIQSKFRQLRVVLGDPRWLPFYFQRRFMAPVPRATVAGLVARHRRPAATPLAVDGSGSEQVAPRADELDRRGISHFGSLLTTAQAAELRARFEALPVSDPYRGPDRYYLPLSEERDPLSHVAHHSARDILMAPYLLAIANRPDILGTVARLLGCKPTLAYLATWWSYPTGIGAQQAEQFHRDVDDWRFIKLFIYLSDVGPDQGPHVYVQFSSRSPACRQIRRFTDDETAAAFGRDNILTLTGSAGEGFLEDTFGLHKGQAVEQGRRLIFQAVYSLSALPYGPSRPAARLDELPADLAAGIDPWVNRLYLSAA
jgi:hypothetical protein